MLQHFKAVRVGDPKYTTSARMVDDIAGEYHSSIRVINVLTIIILLRKSVKFNYY